MNKHKYWWCSRRHVTSHWLAGVHASLTYVVGWWHVCHSSFIVNCEFMVNKTELFEAIEVYFLCTYCYLWWWKCVFAAVVVCKISAGKHHHLWHETQEKNRFYNFTSWNFTVQAHFPSHATSIMCVGILYNYLSFILSHDYLKDLYSDILGCYSV